LNITFGFIFPIDVCVKQLSKCENNKKIKMILNESFHLKKACDTIYVCFLTPVLVRLNFSDNLDKIKIRPCKNTKLQCKIDNNFKNFKIFLRILASKGKFI